MLKRCDLHKYQVEAIHFIKRSKECALFMDMGLGKTITTLTVISDWLKENTSKKILIVAPLRVANTVWEQENGKWEHTRNGTIEICTGTLKNRKKVLENCENDITVINKENLHWLIDNYTWVYDTVIIDESSSFKSHKSKRFKALKSVRSKIKNIILLTGTPAPNGYLDLWSQIYLIDKGFRLGKNVTAYKTRYFRPSGYMGYSWELIKNFDKVIQNKIKDCCLTLKASDHLDMPELINVNRYVELPQHAKEDYKTLSKEFLLSLGSYDIEVNSSAVLGNKLLQFCNGSIYDNDRNIVQIHDEKVKELQQIVEDNPNENFLIAYNYKHDLEKIKSVFKDCDVLGTSTEQVEKWNNGNIKILLAHPKSAAHGLNLQRGGSIVVWFGLNWDLELYEQFNARLYRQGQSNSVRIIHLIVKNGMDEKVLKALQNKAKTQNELKQFLKRDLT